MRDWFETRTVTVPRHDRLINEVTSIRYRFTSDGRVRVESKDEMKKRGFSSPDVADALALSFAAGADTPLAWASAGFNRRRERRGAVQEWVV